MHRVLVIDDNPDDLALAEVALSRAGFEVWLLDEPLRSVEIAAAHEAAAILLDRRMPDSSGIEVLRALRADPRTRSIPVLFLSADGDVAARVEGLQEGADDYLAKPFHPAELVLRVERLVSRGSMEVHSLEGKIEDVPLADVLQTLAVGRRNGVLIAAVGEIGRLVITQGEILSASLGRLTGREALVDLVTARKGRFRFVARATSSERAATSEPIDLQSALLEAAWLEDELRRIESNLPASDGLLWLKARPKLPVPARPLPIEDVGAFLERRPGSTLAEVVSGIALAPKRLTLAIAMLIDEGSIAVASAPAPVSFEAEEKQH